MTRNDDRIREIRKNRFKTMNWAYWAQPKPIAVRDGKSIGLSRYAKLERGNLNSPKTIAVRDDRSSATIAVRGVFREQNDYFNHREGAIIITREAPLKPLRTQSKLESTILHFERLKATVETSPTCSKPHLCNLRRC
ncbi:hypothetical protein E3N88_37514 [Mikania micrantha]|uniref:Uncharacterized protein n=1 Tax=Mikania micrantha TaxID=192012 RepID=A0A5N6LRB9_9ASTR|nr:hypothetical protein E3N88_37514 [Mikania micrantha]